MGSDNFESKTRLKHSAHWESSVTSRPSTLRTGTVRPDDLADFRRDQKRFELSLKSSMMWRIYPPYLDKTVALKIYIFRSKTDRGVFGRGRRLLTSVGRLFLPQVTFNSTVKLGEILTWGWLAELELIIFKNERVIALWRSTKTTFNDLKHFFYFKLLSDLCYKKRGFRFIFRVLDKKLTYIHALYNRVGWKILNRNRNPIVISD